MTATLAAKLRHRRAAIPFAIISPPCSCSRACNRRFAFRPEGLTLQCIIAPVGCQQAATATLRLTM
jgi:hypothetical protein